MLHISLVFCVLLFRFACPCPLGFILCDQCCQCLLIVHSWFPLWFPVTLYYIVVTTLCYGIYLTLMLFKGLCPVQWFSWQNSAADTDATQAMLRCFSVEVIAKVVITNCFIVKKYHFLICQRIFFLSLIVFPSSITEQDFYRTWRHTWVNSNLYISCNRM
jgi:hypothetical protein